MGLVDKLKNAGKALGIMGALISPVYLGGCSNVEPGPLHPSRLLFDGTKFSRYGQGQETRGAQGIQAPGRNTNNLNYPYVGEIEIKENEFFLCNYHRGDLNNNGSSNPFTDPFEYEGLNKKIFSKNEKIGIGTYTYGLARALSEITITLYEENKGKIYENKHKINSDEDGWVITFNPGDLKEGRYYTTWAIDSIFRKNKTLKILEFGVVEN